MCESYSFVQVIKFEPLTQSDVTYISAVLIRIMRAILMIVNRLLYFRQIKV